MLQTCTLLSHDCLFAVSFSVFSFHSPTLLPTSAHLFSSPSFLLSSCLSAPGCTSLLALPVCLSTCLSLTRLPSLSCPALSPSHTCFPNIPASFIPLASLSVFLLLFFSWLADLPHFPPSLPPSTLPHLPHAHTFSSHSYFTLTPHLSLAYSSFPPYNVSVHRLSLPCLSLSTKGYLCPLLPPILPPLFCSLLQPCLSLQTSPTLLCHTQAFSLSSSR